MLILDGGSTSISNFLTPEEPQSPLISKLWTAAYSQISYTAVQRWHKSFLDAGSNIITTNTYQIPPASYYPDLNIPEVMRAAVEVAVKAVQDHGKGAIALSLGTRNSIVGKREYDTSPLFSVQEYYEFHKERLKDYEECFGKLPKEVEYLAFETISSYEEAEAILSLLANERNSLSTIIDKKVWITFSAGDGSLQRMDGIFSKLFQSPNIKYLWGIGFNCVGIDIAGHFTRMLVEKTKEATVDLWMVLYPDAGKFCDNTTAQFTDKAERLEIEQVMKWADEIAEVDELDGGRVVLGGCCNTDDRFIAALARKVGRK